MVSYSKRESLFEKTERTWTVDVEGLHITSPGQGDIHVRFSAIRRLRLAFAPTRLKPDRFACTIFVRNGPVLCTDNMHFRGIANFEDRSDSYRAVVEALLDGIAKDRSDFQVDIGSGAYWIMLAFVLVTYAALMALLLITGGVGWPVVAIVKLAILVVTLPLLIRWIVRSRPRKAAINALPADALP